MRPTRNETMIERSKRGVWLGLLLGAVVGAAAMAPGRAEAANTALKDLMKQVGAASADAKTAESDADKKKANAALGALLDKVAAFKPNDPDFAGWPAAAADAAAKAKAGDPSGCKGCHDQYRDKYKTKYGSKAP